MTKLPQLTILRGALGVVGGVTVVLLWWTLTSRTGVISPFLFPPPTDVLAAAQHLTSTGGFIVPQLGGYGGLDLWSHILLSTMRVIVGFGLCLLIAVPLALAIVSSRRVEQALNPLIHLFRPIPPIAWVPLAVLWLGTTSQSIIFIIVIGTLWPMVIGSVAGFRSVPPVLIRAGRSLGANSVQTYARVMLPASMPYLFPAARVTFGIAWWTIVPAELAAGRNGLGYLIIAAQENFNTADVIVGMLCIGCVGLALDLVLRALQNMRLFRAI